MLGEKKLFAFQGRTFKLYAPEDLGKKWFVEWYDAGKRQRKYGNINSETSYKGRLVLAEQFAQSLANELTPVKTVDQCQVEDHIQGMAAHCRASTITNVVGIANQLFTWLNGRQLDRVAMEEFFAHVGATRHTTTYNVYRQWLSKICDAIDRPNLFINIEPVKTIKTPARFFQAHQVARLRDEISACDPQLWLYIQFVFYCFIRPSRELPPLKAGDIMLQDREIIIRGAHSKNKKTQYVAIPDSFMPALSFVYDLGPNEYIFPGCHDPRKPIGRNTMSQRHRDILRRLKFGSDYCLYSWKHTGAVMAIKAGIGVKQLQIQLRHHSLDETDKYLRQMGVRDVGNLRSDFPGI